MNKSLTFIVLAKSFFSMRTCRQRAVVVKIILSLIITASIEPQMAAQAVPTASRAVDLQAGASFNLTQSDYSAQLFKGFGLYTTFDFTKHLGLDAEFHQADGKQDEYERTFEVGPRYVMRFGPLSPYAKLMVGRSVFNFPPAPSAPNNGPAANLVYNMWAVGFGVDYKVHPSINLRVDYEFQQWNRFPPNGLTPRVLSIGVAYHFR